MNAQATRQPKDVSPSVNDLLATPYQEDSGNGAGAQ
jgi:hypothetical protein